MKLDRADLKRHRRSRRPRPLALEPLDRRNLLSGFGFRAHPDAIVSGGFPRHGWRSTAEPATATAGPARAFSNVDYTGHGSSGEHLDLVVPAGTPPSGGWPVILGFPGGGWRWASRQQYEQEIGVLTKYGFAVAGVDVAYAGTTPNGSHAWPTNLQDAEQAVQWVDKHAQSLHLDPTKIVAMGDSAGANMALLLGTYPDSKVATEAPPAATGAPASHVAAVVDFYGPADMTALYGQSRLDALPYIDTYLGGSPSQYPGRFAAASPTTYINSSTPPMLILQGELDHTVPVSQALELDAALTKAGVPHELITIPWATHGFGLNLAGYDLTASVVNFLDAALHLPAGGTAAKAL